MILRVESDHHHVMQRRLAGKLQRNDQRTALFEMLSQIVTCAFKGEGLKALRPKIPLEI